MTRIGFVLLGLLAGLVPGLAPLGVAPVRAGTAVRVTADDHPYFGRVVLAASDQPAKVIRNGERVVIQFDGDPVIGNLPPAPRNVRALRLVPGGVELMLAPGATLRDWRTGGELVLDIGDGAAPAEANHGRPIPDANHTPVKPDAAAAKRPAPPVPAPHTPAVSSQPPPTPAPRTQLPPIARAPMPGSEQVDPPRVSVVGASAAKDRAAEPEPARASLAPDPEPKPAPEVPEAEDAVPLARGPMPVGPVALLARKVPPPPGLMGTAMQIPFAPPVGAALFTRGPTAYAVFDERRPIDLGAFHGDPVFGPAEVSVHQAATVIRLPLPAGGVPVLTRTGAGWRLTVAPSSASPAPLTPVPTNGALTFAAEAPGQVVAIPDPDTGGTLLAGTQRKPGQAVQVARRTAEFVLPATILGILVEPLSDAIALRVTQPGFILSGARTGLALSPKPPMAEAMTEAARLTRRYEFPGQTTADLAWRARRQAIDAATTPPLARGPKRRALAETLLGLGMGVEAQTALRVAVKDDPREAASPATTGLAAIAALLAGRPDQAADLADPRLTGTDEIALWRAIQTARRDEASPAAAAVFATTAPLVFTYPEELRRQVLPLVLETMALGGQADAAAHLLAQRENDPALAYARGLVKQAKGDQDGALALFDAVAKARDPRDHARAAVRAVETRLANGTFDAKAAAAAIDKLLYAWRGDQRDLSVRLRLAALRRLAGEWRGAFSLLRGAKADFPAHAAEIDLQLQEAFAALPHDRSMDEMPPTELIALLEENAELLANGPDGAPMRARLAEKLMALDLPKRADTVLNKLMRSAPIGPERAEFGATLAALRLREGDPNGALVALAESNTADVADTARERRALIIAQVDAKRGDLTGALEALAGVSTAKADEARAAILEQVHDWPRAEAAWASYVGRVVPESGSLDVAQRHAVLRLATAAARAGDDAALAALRKRMETRVGAGPEGDLFRLLTAEPVHGTADLGRARAELGLVRAVTSGLGARKPP